VTQIASLLFGFSVLLLSACADREPTYPLLDGGEIRFSELQGKVVFINYWAEWCKPCRTEMPELNEVQKTLGDKVRVLAVNYDGIQGEQLAQQAKAMGIEFSILTEDPRSQFGVMPSGALPETLVIDQRGQFQKVLLGPQTVIGLEQVVTRLTDEMDYPTSLNPNPNQ
jgi:thiol-disulfide isomerase/thioredoxin